MQLRNGKNTTMTMTKTKAETATKTETKAKTKTETAAETAPNWISFDTAPNWISFDTKFKSSVACAELLPFNQRVVLLKKCFGEILENITEFLDPKFDPSFEFIPILFRNTFYENTLYRERHKFIMAHYASFDDEVSKNVDDLYNTIIKIRHAIKVEYPLLKRC